MFRLLAEQPIGDRGRVRTVSRAKLLQNVPHMDLYGAFLHFQFGGDQLVGLALAQEIEHTQLARGQVQLVPQPLASALAEGIGPSACRAQRVRRNKRPSGMDQPERSEGHLGVNRGRDIAPQAVGQRLVDVFDIIAIGKYDHRRVGQLKPDTLERVLYAGIRYACAP